MDFTIIIAILAAMAIAILKDSRKKQAEQAAEAEREEFEPIKPIERAEGESRTLQEIMAQIERHAAAREHEAFIREIVEKKKRLNKLPSKKPQAMSEDSLEVITDEEEAYYASQQPRSTTPKPTTASARKNAPKGAIKPEKRVAASKEKKYDPQEEKHELLRDFDLTRAVVYSEIMEPKFKSYE